MCVQSISQHPSKCNTLHRCVNFLHNCGCWRALPCWKDLTGRDLWRAFFSMHHGISSSYKLIKNFFFIGFRHAFYSIWLALITIKTLNICRGKWRDTSSSCIYIYKCTCSGTHVPWAFALCHKTTTTTPFLEIQGNWKSPETPASASAGIRSLHTLT